ncbi:MAG: DUF2029 domain-containing protein [Planctomycetaceae bacterium]|nr:DUF2029 domain-containing protein [Planctomycetaceae bacterium]
MPSSHDVYYCPIAEVRRHWAVFLGLAVGLAIWSGVDVARRAIVDARHPSGHMTDFTVYTEAGAAFFDGRDPYEVANVRGWKYLYPPLFALVVAPLAHLSTPWQATVWFALSALMAFGCYFELRRLVLAFVPSEADRQSAPRWLFFTALLAALFPALNCMQRGQMGVALIYFLLLGFRLIWLGKSPLSSLVGGVLLSLPIALKLTPALPAGCALALLTIAALSRAGPVGRRGSSRPASLAQEVFFPGLGLVAGCLLFLLLLPAALLGWNANLGYLHTWYEKVGSHVDDVRQNDFGGDVASMRNQSLQNAVYRSGNWFAHKFLNGPDDVKMDVTLAAMPMDAPMVSQVLRALRLAALLGLGAVVVIAGRSSQPLLHGVAFGLAGVATLVVSPVSRGHYFVFWLPAVVFVPLWLHQIGRARAALWLAVVPVVLTIAHYAALRYTGRVGLLGLGTTVWYFATCHQVWIARHAALAPTLATSTDSRPEELAIRAA